MVLWMEKLRMEGGRSKRSCACVRFIRYLRKDGTHPVS